MITILKTTHKIITAENELMEVFNRLTIQEFIMAGKNTFENRVRWALESRNTKFRYAVKNLVTDEENQTVEFDLVEIEVSDKFKLKLTKTHDADAYSGIRATYFVSYEDIGLGSLAGGYGMSSGATAHTIKMFNQKLNGSTKGVFRKDMTQSAATLLFARDLIK